MPKIYAIGETVLDVIFKEDVPRAAKPGGSVLNCSVSLGRLGLPVHLITEYGKDKAGNLIDTFLKKNHISTRYARRYCEPAKTVVSLAFLDEKNCASYSFYKHYPPERSLVFPEASRGDIVMFGSFYAIWKDIRSQLRDFIGQAKKNGALIIYDPNFRKSHLFELETLRPLLYENMSLATLVRVSDEDCTLMFGTRSFEEAKEKLGGLCERFIYTSSQDKVYLKTREIECSCPVKKLEPVSTVGAGDSFNAGLIWSLFRRKIKPEKLSELTVKD